jgi:sugar-specific transcriptional regulator TrmB
MITITVAESSRDRRREELCDRLVEFGLTEYEAETLVALVRLGTGTAKEVAEVGDVPRSRVYDAVETLRERGFVDVQYASPREFAAAPWQAIVGRLDRERRRTVSEVEALFDRVGSADARTDGPGAWTVTGRDAVVRRVRDVLAGADGEVAYLGDAGAFDEGILDDLADAADRGVAVHVGGVSEATADRVTAAVPSVAVLDVPWRVRTTPVRRLLVADRRTALVAVATGSTAGGGGADADAGVDADEVAVRGTGARNALVGAVAPVVGWLIDRGAGD